MQDAAHSSGKGGWGIGEAEGHYSGDKQPSWCFESRFEFDIRWGYHNIRIKEEDQLKAAFKTPRGLFIPRVMTFGLTNAPATFARTMSRILRSLMDTHPKELFVYMDDVLIATEEDLPRHRKIVHAFLEICENESYFL